MKRLLIVALFILGTAIPLAQALTSTPLLYAQAESGQQSSPAETPTAAEPVETPPAPAPAETPPATMPAEAAAAPSPEQGTAAISGKQSHKEFSDMEIRACASCHKGEKVAPTHGADWTREHRLFAGKSSKNCNACHDQQFCLDCHMGGGIRADLMVDNAMMNYTPHSHRTDFREIHPIKALDNPQTCTRCHDSRFCSDCHARFRGEDLMVLSHRRAWSDLEASAGGPTHSTFNTTQCQTCHPGGVLPTHVWSADHAREARRNLQACQTCHSDGTICQTCHSARAGLRINPHPRNWSAVKDKYRSRSGGRSCIVCHDTF